MNENYKLTNAQNMKKLILLPYLFLLGLLLQAQTETLYPWTDTQGRTLQASFISLDSGKVTIKWNGQIVPIPLTNLSPETQALAKKLATESLKLPTPVAASNSSGIYPWTDAQGRTLQARFIRLFAGTVTIEWNGQMVPLPMNSLSPASQALANKLAASKTAPTTKKPEPLPTTPKKVAPKIMPTVVTEDVALDEEHNWQATNGSLIKAKFLSMDGDNVNLLVNQGRSEATVPISRFKKSSQDLAKKLNADLTARKKMREAEASKRMKMKVPKLEEADITRYHKWESADGNEIDAVYIDAGDEGVTLLMRSNPNRPYELGWERLSAESQALAEGIRRLKAQLMPLDPRIAETKGGSLTHYSEGKWKNYNTVLESAMYDVALHRNGYTVHVWLKNEAKKGEEGLGERAQRNPLSVNFRPIYYLNPGERNRQWKHRRISSFEEPPPVSMDREETTIKGTFDNNATFEYTMQINHRGLSFWGKIDEDRNEEHPTIFSIAFYSPNFIPDVTNMQLDEIEPLVGDGCLYIDPMESKRAKIPMMTKWDDIMKKFAGADWNPIKSAEFMGKPFGSHKIKITPASTSGMVFRWSKGYSGIYPFQAIHLGHRTEDSYNASQSKEPGQFKKRNEIPRNKRLNVNIIRGRG
ncbi:hypothetical protein N9H45_08330 [Opitutales bacterium]|nr:hypothetical protein [Opitutales bacterium]